jgi:hypothetical protein
MNRPAGNGRDERVSSSPQSVAEFRREIGLVGRPLFAVMALLANDDGQEWPSYSGAGCNHRWVYSPQSSSAPPVWTNTLGYGVRNPSAKLRCSPIEFPSRFVASVLWRFSSPRRGIHIIA